MVQGFLTGPHGARKSHYRSCSHICHATGDGMVRVLRCHNIAEGCSGCQRIEKRISPSSLVRTTYLNRALSQHTRLEMSKRQ